MKNLSELEAHIVRLERILESSTDSVIAPVRRSLFKRFPITAVLIVTFGVTATTYGAERLYQKTVFLNEHPLVLFVLGLVALMVTGKLYQKLG